MAAGSKTFLEAFDLVSSMGFFDLIIPFFMVFAVSYAFLVKSKFLGESNETAAIVSFFLSIVVLMFPTARSIILVLVPFFSVFAVIMFLSIFVFMLFGVGEKDIKTAVSKPQGYIFLLIMALIMFFIVLGVVLGPSLSPEGLAGSNQSGVGSRVVQIVFDPRVFGTLILMVFFAITIYLITQTGGKKDKKD